MWGLFLGSVSFLAFITCSVFFFLGLFFVSPWTLLILAVVFYYIGKSVRDRMRRTVVPTHEALFPSRGVPPKRVELTEDPEDINAWSSLD